MLDPAEQFLPRSIIDARATEEAGRANIEGRTTSCRKSEPYSCRSAGAVAAGTAFAPTVSIATSQSMTDKAKSTTEDVSKWTQKQWDAAKAKWVKQKDKWNSCNKQAADKKLSGRDSWSFLYTCMTS